MESRPFSSPRRRPEARSSWTSPPTEIPPPSTSARTSTTRADSTSRASTFWLCRTRTAGRFKSAWTRPRPILPSTMWPAARVPRRSASRWRRSPPRRSSARPGGSCSRFSTSAPACACLWMAQPSRCLMAVLGSPSSRQRSPSAWACPRTTSSRRCGTRWRTKTVCRWGAGLHHKPRPRRPCSGPRTGTGARWTLPGGRLPLDRATPRRWSLAAPRRP
mmetsp:Transcript_43046/g.71745  ORF Transcript_43046/g.71745 Transcript_43046/m.71745 type:complete len:218 (-) Transcript_43046:1080-1733(-)